MWNISCASESSVPVVELRDEAKESSGAEQTERLREHLERADQAIDDARRETERIEQELRLRFPLASSTRLRKPEDAD